MKKQIVTIEELVERSHKLSQRKEPTPPPPRNTEWRNEQRVCAWCGKTFKPVRSHQRFDSRGCYESAHLNSDQQNAYLLRKNRRHLTTGAELFQRTLDPSLRDDDPYGRYEEIGVKDETPEIIDQLSHGTVFAKHAGHEANYTEINTVFRSLEHALNKVPEEEYRKARAWAHTQLFPQLPLPNQEKLRHAYTKPNPNYCQAHINLGPRYRNQVRCSRKARIHIDGTGYCVHHAKKLLATWRP